MHNSFTTRVIIIHKCKIALEEYPQMTPTDKHLYFSVSKKLVSNLTAILEDRNLINVSKSIEYYMPELKDSGWEGMPLIDILRY